MATIHDLRQRLTRAMILNHTFEESNTERVEQS
jgi:hypothetical protein